MLGLDINGVPRDIKDQYFLFHKNGSGDIARNARECKGWNPNVYDLGTSPVLMQPTAEACRQYRLDCEPKKIMVRAANGCGSDDPPFVETLVSGLGVDGFPIYSYNVAAGDIEDQNNTVACACSKQDLELNHIQGNEGVKFPITASGKSADILFSTINNIIKPVTPYPVEYWMVDKYGVSTMIARLEPWQVLSQYHIYQIPQKVCNLKTVLGLFKRNRPEQIVDGSQLFISSNLEAIKSLAIAMDYKYNKKNIQAAIPYLQDAATQLNAELQEEKTATDQSLQIDRLQSYERTPKM
jgi:hypothetical protein